MTMAYGDPTGVNKILVEKYGYEWVNGKAWRPGTAPEPEIIPEEEPVAATPPEPSQPAETPIEEPTSSEPVSLEERIEQLQASLNELQKKYEEALEKLEQTTFKLEQANARIAELEGQQSEASTDVSDADDTAVVPEENPTPEPQQPAEADEAEAVTPETPEVTAPEPEPTPQPSYPEPTGVNKILVEKYGYEWVNGKAWKPGTVPKNDSSEGVYTVSFTLDISDDDLKARSIDFTNTSGETTSIVGESGLIMDVEAHGSLTVVFNSRDNDGHNVNPEEYRDGNDLVFTNGIYNPTNPTELIRLKNLFSSDVGKVTYKWAAAGYDNDYSILLASPTSTETDETQIVFGTRLDDVINTGDGANGGWDENGKFENGIGSEAYGASGNDLINGGTGWNFLNGGLGDDTVYGHGGRDWIFGDFGNDILYGGYGDDMVVAGGPGNDEIYGGGGDDTLRGDDGNDILNGDDGDDVIWGDTGNDRLNGGLGDDSLTGGPGNDTFIFKIDDDTNSFGHDEVLDFTAGEDTLEFYDQDWNWLTSDSFTETYNADNQRVLSLKEAAELHHTVLIKVGGTSVLGEEPIFSMSINGEYVAHNQTIISGQTNTFEYSVDDTVREIIFHHTNGGWNSDEQKAVGTWLDDLLIDGSPFNFSDTIFLDGEESWAGVDSYENLNPGYGRVKFETSEYSKLGSSITITEVILNGVEITGTAGFDLTGTGQDDIITSNDNENIFAGAGDDIVYGGPVSNSAYQYIFGEAGNDTLYAGEIDTFFSGGLGVDILDGSIEGKHRADYRYSEYGINANLETGAAFAIGFENDNDTLISIYRLIGSDHNDQLYGNENQNSFSGNLGDDYIDGQGGSDFVWYGRSPSSVTIDLGEGYASGGEGDDTLVSIEGASGSEFEDILNGNEENNWLDGSGGNDTLNGRAGDDTLLGGAGNDTFVFDYNFGNDTIKDFERGVDVLTYAGTALVGTTLDGDEILSFRDGSSITLEGTAPSKPNHHTFSVGDNIFTLVSSAKSYQDATEYAEDIAAKLVSFEDEEKFDGFYDALSNLITAKGLTPTTAADGGGAKYVWLGATDQLNEGTWIWESGSQMTYNNWGSGAYGSEPDNSNNQDGLALGLENWPAGSADGAGFGDSGYWNDIDTSNELYFVVEIA